MNESDSTLSAPDCSTIGSTRELITACTIPLEVSGFIGMHSSAEIVELLSAGIVAMKLSLD
jgi:hypothetical protein